MDIKQIQQILNYAAGVLGAAGSERSKAKAVSDVADLLGDAPEDTVDDFVSNTEEALDGPSVADLEPTEIATQLRAMELVEPEFKSLISQLKTRQFSKAQALDIANAYLAIPIAKSTSKTRAIQMMEKRAKDRRFQESRARVNEGVTPW